MICPILNCPRDDEHTHPDKCQALEDLEGVMPGWGCCVCTVYNGKQRTKCRGCGHTRCDS